MPPHSAITVDLPQPWRAFLRELDGMLPEPVQLHCLGGFALTVVYGVTLPTDDLDFISAVPSTLSAILQELGGLSSPLAKRHRVFLQQVGVGDYPENYDKRLTDLCLDLEKLRLSVLDPYDIVLAKLTRNSPKDREHVRQVASGAQLSFQVLQSRFDAEMKPWLPNLERHELTLRLWSQYFPR